MREGVLAWGRRFLMCPPDDFDVVYEINPYMHVEVHPDPDRARMEFEGLASTLCAAGAVIERMEPVEGLPDLVFTANAGLVDVGGPGGTGTVRRVVPARFRHPERRAESAVDERWFRTHGFEVAPLPGDGFFEGAGDALPFGGGRDRPPVLVGGYRTRSSVDVHAELSRLLGVPVRSVELVDERFYHVDLVFCPLDDRHALVAGQGLDRYGCRVVEELVPEPIWLEDEEARVFSANSVVVGDVIVMPACSPRLGRILEGLGLDVVLAPVGEFMKAGGGCRCLTLALDVPFSGPAETGERRAEGESGARSGSRRRVGL